MPPLLFTKASRPSRCILMLLAERDLTYLNVSGQLAQPDCAGGKGRGRSTSTWVKHPTANIVASETASWVEFAILLLTRRIAWVPWYAISLLVPFPILAIDRAEWARACMSAGSVIAKLMMSSLGMAHENA